ncbi:hypothetical protein M419DRAFT_125015 [Trichoderma reesei RUT C-30]|uniref:Uncharacterized protein n=1 Tax=Hypocrea jecorina (strain ATCC 56765 / BCRC 32924 / NRRL 11460 / Rut C-30) TaxID=1344414 RepID=A0A024RY07_HYPJR|nr:hypothetical protein M419DRAFT_125015 [Trichoderma reesei RUT C-30]
MQFMEECDDTDVKLVVFSFLPIFILKFSMGKENAAEPGLEWDSGWVWDIHHHCKRRNHVQYEGSEQR